MTEAEARALAREWIDAWNAHDLDRILAYMTTRWC
jgi:ketosteroid isomerase-like protein